MQCSSLPFIHYLRLHYNKGTQYSPTAGKPSPTPPSQVDNLFSWENKGPPFVKGFQIYQQRELTAGKLLKYKGNNNNKDRQPNLSSLIKSQKKFGAWSRTEFKFPPSSDQSHNHNYIQFPYLMYFGTFSPINRAASFSGILRFMAHFSFFLYFMGKTHCKYWATSCKVLS